MPLSRVPGLFGRALKGWWADNVPRLGASLAFYTIFAMAPVLVVAIAVAGAVYGEDAVRGRLVTEIEGLTGAGAANTIQQLLARSADRGTGVLASVLGGVTFVFASTGAFLELQAALNQIWGVKATPAASIGSFLRQRIISFGLVVAIGFLLLVSLAVSAVLTVAAEWVAARVPDAGLVVHGTSFVLSFAVITVLFALLYKVLPDVRIAWRDVWVGAAATALLFSIGKYLIGLYLGGMAPTSGYAAAGSFIVFLLWVYYSSQIVLLGAEFTRQWTERDGERREVEPHAAADEQAAQPATGPQAPPEQSASP